MLKPSTLLAKSDALGFLQTVLLQNGRTLYTVYLYMVRTKHAFNK